ncbi:MAG: STAS domain-containing protein [Gammaproteobacteria bacterium]|nr:STAS domain-containing protein [Gammaproteobacteria bacterium]
MSFTTVPELLLHSGALFNGEAETIIVDLADVERADSAGLSLLIQWWRQARQANKSIYYANLPEQMGSMAKLGGLDDKLPLQS